MTCCVALLQQICTLCFVLKFDETEPSSDLIKICFSFFFSRSLSDVLQRRCQPLDRGRELHSSVRLQQSRLEQRTRDDGAQCRLHSVHSSSISLPAVAMILSFSCEFFSEMKCSCSQLLLNQINV